jgi:hypothetical protein
MIESLLLAVTRVSTWFGTQLLTGATGFFFERDGRLFLVSNRHVVLNEASGHRPDRLEIELHTCADDVARTVQFSIPLYRDGKPLWRERGDHSGSIDVMVLQLDRAALPEALPVWAFNPAHLVPDLDRFEVGHSVVIVGFPLGFHDTFHRLPVARQAVIASAFGIRFQGQGYFLTDARMHRGTSGAPVVARIDAHGDGRSGLPWTLLGIHAARIEADARDASQDERLDLNCAWYADVLMALTA